MAAQSETTFIAFDLETTGFIDGDIYPHITQIAATEIGSTESFSRYVMPRVPITEGAKKVNHMNVTDSGIMTVNDQKVEPISIKAALDEFCKWLGKFPNVVLVAHNGFDFDYRVIMSALINTNTVDLFLNSVTWLIDSLPLFRERFPEEPSHKQVKLAKSLLKIDYDAHNAISDVETLAKLVNFTNLSPDKLLSYKVSAQSFFDDFI